MAATEPQEHDEYSRHRASARNMLADIQALGSPGKRRDSKKDARRRSHGGQRLESLRQHAAQSHSEERQAFPSRPRASTRGSGVHSAVVLPAVVDSADPRSVDSSPIHRAANRSDARSSTLSVSCPDLRIDLNVSLDLRGTGDFSQSFSIGRKTLERSETQVMREAVSVMFRNAEDLKEEKTKGEDQKRLCFMLRQAGDGCLLRGWRCELDTSGALEVDWEDYLQAAKRLKYSGDPRFLFSNEEHTLRLKELSPPDFELLDGFKQWVKETFGGPSGLFQALVLGSSTREVSKERFVEVVQERGFQPDEVIRSEVEVCERFRAEEALFCCCDWQKIGVLKYEDCIFLEVDPFARARESYKIKLGRLMVWKQEAANEYMAYKKKVAQEKGHFSVAPKHRLAPKPWMADTFERMPTVLAQAHQQRQIDAILKERNARKAFLDHLCKNYGNEVRALRHVLSADGYGFGQRMLRSYVRRLNLAIDPMDLWNALDVDRGGHVSLEKLCVRNALILASFQQWARKEPILGSCAAIWDTTEAASIARKRTGTWYQGKKMMGNVFVETVAALGWPMSHDAKARSVLLGALDTTDCGLISLADLAWLDKWRPVDWVYAEPDTEAWAQVKLLLMETYGHPLRAWRAILDADDSNSVDWPEFKKACQKLKFKGNVGGAWRALDAELVGKISMKQYDLASATLLASFKEWAEATFGSIICCFKALDTDGSGALTFNELKRANKKFNWEGDTRLLFDCLDVDRARNFKDHGKRSISLNEIAFLDSWHVELTEEEITSQQPPKTPKSRTPSPSKRVAAVVARLAGGPPADFEPMQTNPISPSATAPHFFTPTLEQLPQSPSYWSDNSGNRPLRKKDCRNSGSSEQLRVADILETMFPARTVKHMESPFVALPQVHSSRPNQVMAPHQTVAQRHNGSNI